MAQPAKRRVIFLGWTLASSHDNPCLAARYFDGKSAKALVPFWKRLRASRAKIKAMQRQAYGFRDREFYKLKILGIHESQYALVG